MSSRSPRFANRRCDLSVKRPQGAGSALLEALFALTILGIALLMLAAFVGLHARSTRKVADHQRVTEFVEARYEEVRAGGLVPCETGTKELDVTGLEIAEDFSLTVDVEVLHPSDLCRVKLHARYRTSGLPAQLLVETMIWRPS